MTLSGAECACCAVHEPISTGAAPREHSAAHYEGDQPPRRHEPAKDEPSMSPQAWHMTWLRWAHGVPRSCEDAALMMPCAGLETTEQEQACVINVPSWSFWLPHHLPLWFPSPAVHQLPSEVLQLVHSAIIRTDMTMHGTILAELEAMVTSLYRPW